MKLIKYRDAGLHTYTYFYVDDRDKVVSPYFDSPDEAEKWLQTTWDNWKANKECGS